MAGDERVLDGVRVVELAGDVGGEMLGKLLAEMGADVVKVEPPGGIAEPRRRTVRPRPASTPTTA